MNKFGQKDPKTNFVCWKCGKMSNDLYGFDPISKGWDESCMLNAKEVYFLKLIINEGLCYEVLTGGFVE